MNTQDNGHGTVKFHMVPVTSSQVKKIGYDAESKTLAVEFTSGATYHYTNVPPEKHQALMSAESKGKALHKHIKGAHDFKKIA